MDPIEIPMYVLRATFFPRSELMPGHIRLLWDALLIPDFLHETDKMLFEFNEKLCYLLTLISISMLYYSLVL